MAVSIIVEDGTLASASANSYVSVAEADTYCEGMGYTTWADADDEDKKTAILRAMVYIEQLPFKGYKTAFANPLQWPRMGVYGQAAMINGYAYWDTWPENEIPQALKRGLCEAAYLELTTPGTFLPSQETNIKREKLDVIETEYFQVGAGVSSKTVFAKIEALMVDILNKGGGAVRLVRT